MKHIAADTIESTCLNDTCVSLVFEFRPHHAGFVSNTITTKLLTVSLSVTKQVVTVIALIKENEKHIYVVNTK